MKRIAGAVLILVLAACSKPEPPPVAQPAVAPAAAPEKTAGTGLSRDDGGPRPPPPPAPTPAPTAAHPLTPAVVPAPTVPAVPPVSGEEIFTNTCATCHMADGGGVPNLQPSIISSAWISNPDPQLLLSLILRGSAILGAASEAYSNDMAPQEQLSDVEIAAVASYVRTRFAATPITVPVTPAQVAIARRRPGLPQ